MQIQASIECVVEKICRARDSKFKPDRKYHPVLFLDRSKNGDEAKIWKNLNPGEAAKLRQGMEVTLLSTGTKNGQTQYNLLLNGGATEGSAPPSVRGASSEDAPLTAENAFEEKLRVYAKRYGKCIKAAGFVMAKEMGADPSNLDATIVQAIASDLFRQSLG